MPHVQVIGTAWERYREEYAYTRDLNLTGWAWEFLRRNKDYQRDFRMNRAGHPIAIKHVSGATLHRPRRRFLAAEAWGLELFADPCGSAREVDVFWLQHLLTYSAHCHCEPANDATIDQLSLSSFPCRRAVLVSANGEHLTLQGHRKAVDLSVDRGTFLFGDSAVTFMHEGIGTASRHHASLQILRRLTIETSDQASAKSHTDSKYLDYLIALDGRVGGHSYREIAIVLYGQDQVEAYWFDDARGLKSKVRRAVERGVTLMNGGYLDLL